MRVNKDKNKEVKKKKVYKGPFPINKNFEVESTRKYMKACANGPTVDEFSYQDTTDSVDISNIYSKKKKNIRPRSKQSLIQNWVQKHVSEIITAIIATAITTFFAVFVYNHSNHLVAHDKDIEYIKEKGVDIKTNIQQVESSVESMKDKIYEIDKKVDIHEIKLSKNK